MNLSVDSEGKAAMCVGVGEERMKEGGREGGKDSQACLPPSESEERETGSK